MWTFTHNENQLTSARVARFIFLSACFILAGCASSQHRSSVAQDNTYQRPTLALGTEIVMTGEDPKARLSLTGDQESYKTTQKRIYALLTLPLLTDRYLLEWKWIDPENQIYMETEPIPIGQTGESYQNVQSFHKIAIHGEAAAQRVGTWSLHAVLYKPVGKPEIIERKFKIAQASRVISDTKRVPPPSPPSPNIEPPVLSPALPAADTPPSTPSSQPFQSIRRCPGVADRPSVISLFFEMGRVALSSDMKQILSDGIKRFTYDKLVVRGYHDATGSLSLNRRLSNTRAETVADFLVQQGIKRENIRVAGQVECYFAENDTPANRMQNRRVTVEEDK